MYRCSREGKQWQPQRRSQTTHLSTMQPGPKRVRLVCPLCNGPHALDTSATRQVWCPCAPGDGPLGPTPRGPLTSSTYIPSTPPNSMINSGGLLSGTDALDHRCCCGLLQAAAGCCWFRCWCCYFCLLFSRTRRVRFCRNWLGGIKFLSLLLFTTTSTLLLLLLLLQLIFQVRISFTNAQEHSIPTY